MPMKGRGSRAADPERAAMALVMTSFPIPRTPVRPHVVPLVVKKNGQVQPFFALRS